MNASLKILGIAGSMRRGSYNRAALTAAVELAPKGTAVEIYEALEAIPPYNQDKEAVLPEAVVELKTKIIAADAVLFVTPEYNYSVPGVLKNAIDWASRPHGQSAWRGKPAAVMGASPGALGSARAQYHLRQILVSLDMPTLSQPEVMIANASEKFDARGTLTDSDTRERIAKFLQALTTWATRFKRAS